MEKIDYCIVGGGYAGIFFAHQCILKGKSFVLFDDGKISASKISAGMVNPVVLKKFTTFWLVEEQIKNLQKTMQEMEKYLGNNFFIQNPIFRIFHDQNESELWQKKREKNELSIFLEKEVYKLPTVHNPYGCGKVLKSGYIQVVAFFEYFFEYLKKNKHWIEEKFDYTLLNTENNTYKDLKFKNIIFCEGIGVRNNPFFCKLPIRPNKGHQIEVDFENDFTLSSVVKKKHFLIPRPTQNTYYYGGTYDREDTTKELNASSIQSLEHGLSLITNSSYKIIGKNAAFRPTVADRRPIIGRHNKFERLFIFNGLGARGVLNGAYFSRQLFEYIEYGQEIHPEVKLERFDIL